MALDNGVSSDNTSQPELRGAGRELSDVIKDDSELTLLTSCFSLSGGDFVEYDVGTNRTSGSRQLVYFLNEGAATDSCVIAFARGGLDNYLSQAYSLATKYMVERVHERPISRSVYCGLPDMLNIGIGLELSPNSDTRDEGICLEPGDFSGCKTYEISGIGPVPQNLKVDAVELSDNLELIKYSIGSRYGKLLLFDQGEGIRVALSDERMSFPPGSPEHVIRALFPDTVLVLHRQISQQMVIAPAEAIQRARESRTLGSPTSEVTLLPQLNSFQQEGDHVSLHYSYGEDRFSVSGMIERRNNESVFVAEGPKTINDESEHWLRDTLRRTLELKLPELGFVSLEYQGTQPAKQLLPVLKSFEQLSAEDYLVTFENAGTPFLFHIRRPLREDPTLFVSGRSMGSLANNWARMEIADIFSRERPELRYNGVIYSEI